MAFLIPAQRGFQVIYDLYAGRMWFALAVLAGLIAAQWLVMGLAGFPPVYEGIGY
jgi:hypothetical protein